MTASTHKHRPRGQTLAEAVAWQRERYGHYEPNTGCLLWCGPCDQRGYGRFKFQGRKVLMHRAVLGLTYGGPHVLHKCDTPECMEETHLREGTHADNMADKAKKGRTYNGRGPRKAPPRGA